MDRIVHRTWCAAALLAIASVHPVNAQDFWTSLGYSEADAKERLYAGLTAGPSYVPSIPGLRTLPSAARNAFIANAVAYARRWTQTAEFQQRYADMRESRKPEKPEALMTTAERKARDKAEIQKSIRALDSALAQARGMPEVQAGLREAIQQQREAMKAIDDPGNPMYGKDAEQAEAEAHAEMVAAYTRALKEWEASHPASVTPVIRKSLREFLALAATVDFSARIRREGDAVVFVDPDHESKSPGWKALYRAGPETTAALRAAAQQWLQELR